MITPQLIAQLAATTAHPELPHATGATFHSARVRHGDIFFALPGAAEHGIEHAQSAIERGAAFVVSDRDHPRGMTVADPEAVLLALGRHARSQLKAPVVAISGSVGKTSTKAFTAAALDAFASEGNLNTPRALACTLVTAWLADPRRPLVLELGIDRPGEMDELLDLVEPTHGLLTAIAESHLEQLKDIEGVAREKALLLERSTERFASSCAAEQLPVALPGLIRYGLGAHAEVRGKTSSSDGVQLLEALGVKVELRYPGRAMARNALGALTLAWRLGLDLSAAAARIGQAQLEPGRLERKHRGDIIILDDSYNSNPASAREALEVLSKCPRPRCAILGDMLELGAHAGRLHRELGAATLGFDLIVAVGPLARHIREGNPDALHRESVEQALPLLGRLPQDATVLVKGSRGMRLERMVAALMEGEAQE